MGNRDICKEDVVKSCEIANANQFITKLENTYDEVLFQRGKIYQEDRDKELL